ncbi:hypothetical protein BaRGS_00033382 [Batillaria attramentaria]|uniref:Exosome complex component CSL4 n=1 Tax=Batillaria attramentaria TaxID=370345 RepID=A0ABD0JKG9_9CAEN
MSAPMVCVPGQRVARKDETIRPGPGTYKRNGFIYSSLAGSLQKQQEPDGKIKSKCYPFTMLPVLHPRFCKCAIMSVGKTPLKESFRGMIRKEDVRATEKDRVEMYKCFRPGDIVVARVLSLGDAQSYVLSTAENELGVVIATSEAGATMVPISWCKMQCPRTLMEEFRKVAKVQPEFIEYTPT